jgi:hypothetical protein
VNAVPYNILKFKKNWVRKLFCTKVRYEFLVILWVTYPQGSETENPEGVTIPPFVLGIGGAAIVVLVIIAAILGRRSSLLVSHWS